MKLSDQKSEITSASSTASHRNSVKNSSNEGGGILHRIPDIKISTMEIIEEYDVEKNIAEGCFAKILLVHHRPTNSQVVLKAIHTELTSFREFLKEFHYSYQLSHHPNILSCYQVAFQATNYFIFAQEYAPFGDLASNLSIGGLTEQSCKTIASQLSSALGFMHTKMLVHRDLKLENVLIFALDFSRIKLCDFGATTKEGTLVNRIKHTWRTFLPPEVIESVRNEKFICKSSSDVWQFGILMYSILTGNAPWRKADWVHDQKYAAFKKYQERKTTKIPDNFKRFSPRFLRALRKILDHNVENRAKVTEIMKYIKDKWIDSKMTLSKSASNLLGQTPASDQDSVCVYLNQRESRHSVDENKTRLRRLMSSYGLETPLDQGAVKKRIWEWVLSCEEVQGGDDIESY